MLSDLHWHFNVERWVRAMRSPCPFRMHVIPDSTLLCLKKMKRVSAGCNWLVKEETDGSFSHPNHLPERSDHWVFFHINTLLSPVFPLSPISISVIVTQVSTKHPRQGTREPDSWGPVFFLVSLSNWIGILCRSSRLREWKEQGDTCFFLHLSILLDFAIVDWALAHFELTPMFLYKIHSGMCKLTAEIDRQ